MQKQKNKNRQERVEKNTTTGSSKSVPHDPKPRRLSRRFINVLKSKSGSKDYVVGNIFSLTAVTLLSTIYFAITSEPNTAITAGSLFYVGTGAFVGSSLSALGNGYVGNFKDKFDAFSSSLFQISLLWLSFIPIAVISGASVLGTIAVLLTISALIPSMNTIYSALGRKISSNN